MPWRQPRHNHQPQPQPAAPNPLQGADPTMVAILDRLIAAEERKQEDAEQFQCLRSLQCSLLINLMELNPVKHMTIGQTL